MKPSKKMQVEIDALAGLKGYICHGLANCPKEGSSLSETFMLSTGDERLIKRCPVGWLLQKMNPRSLV
jgi:hypothetical protein